MPAGRRITKPHDVRVEDFKKACNRSGFTGQEILQILVDWYNWKNVIINPTDRVTQSVVNSQYAEHDQMT